MTTARSLRTSGAALAGVAALAVTAPCVVSGQIAGLPSALSISKAEYKLAAISDIDFQQIAVAAASGFGGLLGPSDPYYPGEFNNDALVTGPAGVAYYLIDTAGFVPMNLDRYFFEVGSRGSNAITSGLGAVAYVGAGSVFGVDSPVTQLVKSFVSGGGTGAGFDLGTAIVALTASIPVIGDLASIYFTGTIPGDTTAYGTGLSGLVTYATNKLLPGVGGLIQNLDLNGLITTITGLISTITGGNGIRPWHSEGSDSDSEGSDDADSESETDESESEHSAQSQPAAAVAARVRAKLSAKAPATVPAAAAAAGSETVTAKEAVEAPEATEAAETHVAEAETHEAESTQGTETHEAEAAEAPETHASDATGSSTSPAAPKAVEGTAVAKSKSPSLGAAPKTPRRVAAAVRGLAPKSTQTPHSVRRGKLSRAAG